MFGNLALYTQRTHPKPDNIIEREQSEDSGYFLDDRYQNLGGVCIFGIERLAPGYYMKVFPNPQALVQLPPEVQSIYEKHREEDHPRTASLWSIIKDADTK